MKLKNLLLLLIMFSSASSFALLPYFDVAVGYERLKSGTAGANALGFHGDAGLGIVWPISAEIYFDYLKHSGINNMHTGLKAKIDFFDMVFVKAGAGLVLAKIGTTFSKNFEVVTNAGVSFPLIPLIAATVEAQYRTVFTTIKTHYFGIYGGINIGF